VPTVEPDDIDKEMLARAEKHKNDPVYPLEDVLTEIESDRRRITLRLPKSLHENLIRASAKEGVSLNQCILHQISTGYTVNYVKQV